VVGVWGGGGGVVERKNESEKRSEAGDRIYFACTPNKRRLPPVHHPCSRAHLFA
jgi:hypothetical protein